MKPLIIRNVEIGKGIPKICVSITELSEKEILETARHMAEMENMPFDILEWRVDWFENHSDFEAISKVLKGLRECFPDKPIVFTFRTAEEGGNAFIKIEDYINLNKRIIDSELADFVDLELLKGEKSLRPLIQWAHEKGIYIILSNHDFKETPSKEVLLDKLIQMQNLEGDIIKIAVMPKSKQDVLTLMDATLTMTSEYAQVPVVTMAMAELGMISRVIGEFTGSAITFGAGSKPSAPGQIAANKLAKMLELLSGSLS